MKQLLNLVFLAVCAGLLMGCEGGGVGPGNGPEAGSIRPVARPDTDASVPRTGARTAEQFDTTSQEQRAAALSEAGHGLGEIGRTVASLGAPGRPGFWLETPLVTSESKGRVVYPANGKSLALTLLPLDGPPTGGSRISLPAMRLLGVPLTDLPELIVYGP